MGIPREGEGEGVEMMSSTEHPRCHWPCLAACHATSGATCQKYELLDMFAIVPAISCPVYMSACLSACMSAHCLHFILLSTRWGDKRALCIWEICRGYCIYWERRFSSIFADRCCICHEFRITNRQISWNCQKTRSLFITAEFCGQVASQGYGKRGYEGGKAHFVLRKRKLCHFLFATDSEQVSQLPYSCPPSCTPSPPGKSAWHNLRQVSNICCCCLSLFLLLN